MTNVHHLAVKTIHLCISSPQRKQPPKNKTTSKNKGESNPIQGPTGGALKNDSQSSPTRIAAATSLVNLTVGCLETEGENGDNVLPAIDEEIDKMFPPLRNTLANDIEVVDFAMKDPPPVFQAEGVAAARQSGSADIRIMNLMRKILVPNI